MIGRAIVGWLLRSRARFFVILAVLAVGGLVLAQLGGSSPEPVAAPPPPAVAPQSPSEAPAPVPTGTPTPAPQPAPQVTAQALPPRELAERVAELWVDSSLPADEWLNRLRPLVTDEYGSVTLAQVDPRNVPAMEVTGPATLRDSPDPGTAAAEVPLDTLALRVEMVDTGPGGGWKVSGLSEGQGAVA